MCAAPCGAKEEIDMSDYENMRRHFAEIDEYMANAVRATRAGDSSTPDRLRRDGYPQLADELEQTLAGR
jgi:hypothetical protein